ncbi:MAG: adenylate/guanylate cyclase domain-containing protein [Syntrophomonadaceae bacterium]|nr:adenylate/guanylate cyclase domain-containing protein [Syntrophomonadaceae bacterium]
MLKLKRLFIPCLLLVLFLVSAYFQLWERVESSVYDTWFRLSGAKDPGDQIVIIGMGEKSISELGPLAWPRSTHAALLEQLREARAVAFDLDFDIPGQPDEDRALAQAIHDHGRVVLGYALTFEAAGDDPEQGHSMNIKMPVEDFLIGAAGVGYINMPVDPDNVVRHTTVAFPLPDFPGQFMPSFHLATALVANGLDPEAISQPDPMQLRINNKLIPVDAQYQALSDFWGPAGTFPTYEYSDVLFGRVDPALLRDRICLIGPTSVLEHDYQQTPYTRGNLVLDNALPTPGVEIHASCLKTFLEGRYFQRVTTGTNLLFLLLVWLITTVLTLRRGPWAGLAIVSIMIVAIGGLAYGLWLYKHLWLNCAAPLALTIATYTAVTAESYLTAEMERRKTRALFGRYVSPAVVEELTNHPELVELGGKRQEVTILFSDIRGFTSYSEARAPEEVVSRLNEYLSAMTAIVFKHGGMIDKYMGDGMMAVFGAPVQQADHAAKAIAASQEMREQLVELNKMWEARGEHLFNIGIGLSSGPVVVGNVGSQERTDYTVIGEDVNLASRLEGLNKEHGTQLILSDRTLKSLTESGVKIPWHFEELGQVPVRGFTEPITIYTIRGEAKGIGTA